MGDEILDRVLEFANRQPSDAADTSAHSPVHMEGADEMAKSESEQVTVDEAANDGAAAAVESAVAANGSGAAATGGGLGAAGGIRGVPIPAGAVIFGELTSAFVDGPRLLRFLGDRKHTGALVDAGGGSTQVAILHEGSVVALVGAGSGGSDTRRLDKLSLPGPGAGDEHELTVLTYRPEVSLALGQLVNTTERFERMHGSFVDLPALLAYLRREKANGAVRVSSARDTGIVLIRGGEVLGAYTRQRPELEDAEVVYPLAREADAEIDVHVGALTLPPASVSADSVVG
ncbi:MAG TPA: hypothetical protein VN193_05920 [Candidatus Angelobacter sp.]|nr:hypothetical protein [Candidatus Angelobacter sp.]